MKNKLNSIHIQGKVIDLTNIELDIISGGANWRGFAKCVSNASITGATAGSLFPGFGTVAGLATGIKIGLGVCGLAYNKW